MGGGGNKNPIKQAINIATEAVHAPVREVARAVGADGIVDLSNGLRDTERKIGIGAVDLANNEKGKQQKKADAASAEANRIAGIQAAEVQKQNDAAAYAESESNRMSAGSKSRTLLTGPKGLDDENGVTISRRTLRAR